MHLHAIRLAPPIVCQTLACAMDQPLLAREYVLDDAGVAYAFDLSPTQGFYLTVLAYGCLRAGMHFVRAELLNRTDVGDH